VNVQTLIIAGVIGLAATLALRAVIGSRFVRGRLIFSAWLFLAFLVLELAVLQQFGDGPLLAAIARLVAVLSVVNILIALLVNPWRDDRPSDRFPAIVQDVAIIALFGLIATLLMREQLLATSAVGAVVVGFALQDTLGNFFAGLAIQVEKPFRVGHWIRVGSHEGQVQEVTWRATKLLTTDGQFLILPNSYISKEPILNFSEPVVPTRIDIDVGTSYSTPPNEVRAAIRRALANAPLVMTSRAPQIELNAFGASSLDFKVRFWIEDYGTELLARDQVRTQIWYEFRRSNIEIPWPIQIEYSREEEPLRTEAHVESAAGLLSSVDLFAPLSAEARLSLSRAASEHLFGEGEAIVRQGESGASMFVILHGRVRVVLEPSGQQVARIEAGGFFGEMSVLTGEPRSASVRAESDVRLLEISAAQMRDLVQATPGLLEHISQVMASRRVGLAAAEASAATGAATVQSSRSLLARFQRFLGL
jgi:small-conductance mechanosensitive channel/CRP-like cAMP-binding protein